MWQSRSVDPILCLCRLSNEVEPATSLCLCLYYQFHRPYTVTSFVTATYLCRLNSTCVSSTGLPPLFRVIIEPSLRSRRERVPYQSCFLVSRTSSVSETHSHPSSCASIPPSFIREKSMAGPDINVRASRTTKSGSSGRFSVDNTRDPMAKSIMMMDETNAGS